MARQGKTKLEIEERRRKVREARAKLVEVKRKVTKDGRTWEKSFYGHSREEALKNWKDFVNPPLQPSGETIGADSVPENSVAWWFLVKYAPLKAGKRENTKANIQLAARHLLPEVGYLKIWELTATQLEQALQRIETKKTVRNKSAKPRQVRQPDGTLAIVEPKRILKPLSASLVNRCRRIALEVNELAYDEMPDRVRRINPKWVATREEPDRQVTIYTPPMMRLLFLECVGTVAEVPVLMWAFLGLRLSEGLGALCKDLMPDGVLEVTHQDEGDGTVTTKLKTKNSRRDLPLPEEMVEALRPFAFADPDARLARNTRGEPVLERTATRTMYAAMRRAGLPRATPHELRHSFSTWLDLHGCPQSVRLALMGQSRKAVEDRYNHASPEVMRRWLTKLWAAGKGRYVGPALQPLKPTVPDRKVRARGEANGNRKLTEVKVAEIRKLLAGGKVSAYRIAKDYDVAAKTIRNIRDGKIWADESLRKSS